MVLAQALYRADANALAAPAVCTCVCIDLVAQSCLQLSFGLPGSLQSLPMCSFTVQAAGKASAHRFWHRCSGGYVQTASLPAHRHNWQRESDLLMQATVPNAFHVVLLRAMRRVSRRPHLSSQSESGHLKGISELLAAACRSVCTARAAPTATSSTALSLTRGAPAPAGALVGCKAAVMLPGGSGASSAASAHGVHYVGGCGGCRYEPTSMRAIRARYNPYVQARGRVDQLRKLGHSVDKVLPREKSKNRPPRFHLPAPPTPVSLTGSQILACMNSPVSASPCCERNQLATFALLQCSPESERPAAFCSHWSAFCLQ